jgi:hypothetical protein
MCRTATTFRLTPVVSLITAMVALSSQTSAVSLKVQLACAADYYAYCSKHDPNGPGVRACMSSNGHKLSTRCVNALIAAGEISKSEVQRRTATK